MVWAPHIVVVGGGTAGWLAALVLQDKVRRDEPGTRVTVVESARIPTIGVGEGSTAAFRVLMRQLGLDEFEFLRETGATIKFGIRHKDWRRKGFTYDGPIDDPHQVIAAPNGVPSEYLNVYAVAAGRRLADMHLFGPLLAGCKAPYARRPDGSFLPLGPFHHAFHFDQALVGKYLKRKSKGVECIDATVAGIERDSANGDIRELILDTGKRLAGDFFIDATGFRRRIAGEALNGKWISYAHELPINRAMPFWLNIEPGEEIAPYTLAWAQSAGWLWKIATQERYGCGYVYCDAYATPETAKREIEIVLGHPIEVRADIRIDPGRLESPWAANCLALGLAASFLEPLEATSIHGTIVQLMLFVRDHFRVTPDQLAVRRDAYNAKVARQVDDFRDFVNLHYATERDDTPFWREVRANRMHPATRMRLARWQREMPRREHFSEYLGGLPHVEAQLYYPVLDGLGLLDRQVAQTEMNRSQTLKAFARKTADDLKAEYRTAATKAMGHAEFLRAVREIR